MADPVLRRKYSELSATRVKRSWFIVNEG